VGDGETYLSWLNSNTKADFFVVYYGSDLVNYERLKQLARFSFLDQSPSKFAKIYRYFSENQQLFTQYEYIWLPDDDIWITSKELNSFFQYAISKDLLISQPSVIGFGVRNQFKEHKQEIEIMYSDWVEGMAPFFNAKVLETCLETFSKSQTGWGIDHVWAALISCPRDRIAIVHKYYFVHTTRPGSRYGRFSTRGEDDKTRVFHIYRDLLAKYEISVEPRIFGLVKLESSFFVRLGKKLKVKIDIVNRIGFGELWLWMKAKFSDWNARGKKTS
jgi:hypothetical protein